MNPRVAEISIERCPAERDGDAIAFLRRVFYEELGFTPDPALDKDFEGLVAHYRRGRGELWIATEGGRVVATTALLDLALALTTPGARLVGGEAELKRMFVDRSVRGLGVGRQLLDAAIKHAKASGFERILLDSTSDMVAAITLYRSAGFVEINDYNGNKRANIFMALQIAPMTWP